MLGRSSKAKDKTKGKEKEKDKTKTKEKEKEKTKGKEKEKESLRAGVVSLISFKCLNLIYFKNNNIFLNLSLL